MATLAADIDMPDLTVLDGADRTIDEQRAEAAAAAGESWIARNMFGYSILHYEDVVAMLRDKRWHSASGKVIEMSGIKNPEWDERRRNRPSILSAEGDEHTRLRRLVGPAFSPRHADALRPYMRSVVNELLDPFVANGEAELVADFCEHYPIPIICELFGAPKEDWQLFSTWATDIFRIFNGNLVEDMPLIFKAQDELDAYVSEIVERRRSTPTDDLISSLIAAESDGDRLTHEELVMLCEAVLMAGTDTTRNQLGCSVSLFANHPDQWRMLAERPELAPRAVEETMRYFGAVRGTARFASEDIEYRDMLFPAGTFIGPSLAQANRDPAVFSDPGEFDITREPSNKPQLTFGSGIHFCLGAALARAEQQEALVLMAQRMPDLELAGEITWKPSSVGIFGPTNSRSASPPPELGVVSDTTPNCT